MAVESPPTYAWDWLARQRVAWREIRRRLLASELARELASERDAHPAPSARTVGDVPDWSADHPDLRRSTRTGRPGPPSAPEAATDGATVAATDTVRTHDYRTLDTRADVIAALRSDYPVDAEVRRTVDAAVAEVAFLGRLDVPLHELGVRTAPRGMRWWWRHLGGAGPHEDRSEIDGRDERRAMPPTQLRLVDVLAGYGDVRDV
jgi:hypothetical protein